MAPKHFVPWGKGVGFFIRVGSGGLSSVGMDDLMCELVSEHNCLLFLGVWAVWWYFRGWGGAG